MVDQTSQFFAILTTVGAAKQANADALGIPWTFAQMAVGDGNPNGLENPPLPMPTASQTALLNEWRRAPLNQLKVDPNNAAVIIAEQIIPADVGGKWIREIALYDADGDMVAVANCPPTFKPLLSQGSGRTQVVRLNLLVSSSSNVQLKIDPAIVLATREWVTEELAKQDFKHSVVAATTAAITLSGLQTVDGVALTAGARVLVKNQPAAKDNGLYLVVAGGAWPRCTDADASAKVTPGMLVLVERGIVNADSAWQLVTDAPITLGVTALAYEMAFGRSGVAAGTYRSVTVDAYGRVTAASNPTTVAGYGLTDVYTRTQIDTSLALKAPLASPALTGTPTAPTAPAGNSSSQLANTAFVEAAIAAAGPVFTITDDATDWDTLVTGGWYPKILKNSNPNTPGSEVSYWYCLVLSYGGGSITQVAFPYGTPTTYGTIKVRSRYQGAWNAWSGAYTNNNVATVIKNLLAATTPAAALSALGAAPLADPVFTGAPAAPTPAQFDATTKIATTEFVQRALGNYRASSYNVSTSQVLTPAVVGSTLATNTAANITLTMPPVADVIGGGTITIYNQGTGVTTLVASGVAGGGALHAGAVTLASIVLQPGDSVALVRVPGDGLWHAIGGSVANQYSGAMKAPVWDTAPRFNKSTRLATTEFVQQAIGGYSGYYGYPNNGQTIPPEHVNGIINLNSAATSVTLPLASSVPVGSVLYIRSSRDATINRQGTDTIYVNSTNTSAVSVDVGVDSNITLMALGSSWFIAGNASLSHDKAQFGFSKGSNGYQKLPSGIVIQWCNGQIAANQSSARITLAEAFSTSLVAYSLGTANAGHWVTGQNASTTGIDIIPRTVSAGNIIIPTGIVGYTSIFIGY